MDKARQEALANMIRAEGESEAARLITSASTPRFVELRRLEAARDIAEALAPSPHVTYLPASSPVLLNLPAKL